MKTNGRYKEYLIFIKSSSGNKKKTHFVKLKNLRKFLFLRPTANIQHCKLPKLRKAMIFKITNSTHFGRGQKHHILNARKMFIVKGRKLNFQLQKKTQIII